MEYLDSLFDYDIPGYVFIRKLDYDSTIASHDPHGIALSPPHSQFQSLNGDSLLPEHKRGQDSNTRESEHGMDNNLCGFAASFNSLLSTECFSDSTVNSLVTRCNTVRHSCEPVRHTSALVTAVSCTPAIIHALPHLCTLHLTADDVLTVLEGFPSHVYNDSVCDVVGIFCAFDAITKKIIDASKDFDVAHCFSLLQLCSSRWRELASSAATGADTVPLLSALQQASPLWLELILQAISTTAGPGRGDSDFIYSVWDVFIAATVLEKMDTYSSTGSKTTYADIRDSEWVATTTVTCVDVLSSLASRTQTDRVLKCLSLTHAPAPAQASPPVQSPVLSMMQRLSHSTLLLAARTIDAATAPMADADSDSAVGGCPSTVVLAALQLHSTLATVHPDLALILLMDIADTCFAARDRTVIPVTCAVVVDHVLRAASPPVAAEARATLHAVAHRLLTKHSTLATGSHACDSYAAEAAAPSSQGTVCVDTCCCASATPATIERIAARVLVWLAQATASSSIFIDSLLIPHVRALNALSGDSTSASAAHPSPACATLAVRVLAACAHAITDSPAPPTTTEALQAIIHCLTTALLMFARVTSASVASVPSPHTAFFPPTVARQITDVLETLLPRLPATLAASIVDILTPVLPYRLYHGRLTVITGLSLPLHPLALLARACTVHIFIRAALHLSDSQLPSSSPLVHTLAHATKQHILALHRQPAADNQAPSAVPLPHSAPTMLTAHILPHTTSSLETTISTIRGAQWLSALEDDEYVSTLTQHANTLAAAASAAIDAAIISAAVASAVHEHPALPQCSASAHIALNVVLARQLRDAALHAADDLAVVGKDPALGPERVALLCSARASIWMALSVVAAATSARYRIPPPLAEDVRGHEPSDDTQAHATCVKTGEVLAADAISAQCLGPLWSQLGLSHAIIATTAHVLAIPGVTSAIATAVGATLHPVGPLVEEEATRKSMSSRVRLLASMQAASHLRELAADTAQCVLAATSACTRRLRVALDVCSPVVRVLVDGWVPDSPLPRRRAILTLGCGDIASSESHDACTASYLLPSPFAAVASPLLLALRRSSPQLMQLIGLWRLRVPALSLGAHVRHTLDHALAHLERLAHSRLQRHPGARDRLTPAGDDGVLADRFNTASLARTSIVSTPTPAQFQPSSSNIHASDSSDVDSTVPTLKRRKTAPTSTAFAPISSTVAREAMAEPAATVLVARRKRAVPLESVATTTTSEHVSAEAIASLNTRLPSHPTTSPTAPTTCNPGVSDVHIALVDVLRTVPTQSLYLSIWECAALQGVDPNMTASALDILCSNSSASIAQNHVYIEDSAIISSTSLALVSVVEHPLACLAIPPTTLTCAFSASARAWSTAITARSDAFMASQSNPTRVTESGDDADEDEKIDTKTHLADNGVGSAVALYVQRTTAATHPVASEVDSDGELDVIYEGADTLDWRAARARALTEEQHSHLRVKVADNEDRGKVERRRRPAVDEDSSSEDEKTNSPWSAYFQVLPVATKPPERVHSLLSTAPAAVPRSVFAAHVRVQSPWDADSSMLALLRSHLTLMRPKAPNAAQLADAHHAICEAGALLFHTYARAYQQSLRTVYLAEEAHGALVERVCGAMADALATDTIRMPLLTLLSCTTVGAHGVCWNSRMPLSLSLLTQEDTPHPGQHALASVAGALLISLALALAVETCGDTSTSLSAASPYFAVHRVHTVGRWLALVARLSTGLSSHSDALIHALLHSFTLSKEDLPTATEALAPALCVQDLLVHISPHSTANPSLWLRKVLFSCVHRVTQRNPQHLTSVMCVDALCHFAPLDGNAVPVFLEAQRVLCARLHQTLLTLASVAAPLASPFDDAMLLQLLSRVAHAHTPVSYRGARGSVAVAAVDTLALARASLSQHILDEYITVRAALMAAVEVKVRVALCGPALVPLVLGMSATAASVRGEAGLAPTMSDDGMAMAAAWVTLHHRTLCDHIAGANALTAIRACHYLDPRPLSEAMLLDPSRHAPLLQRAILFLIDHVTPPSLVTHAPQLLAQAATELLTVVPAKDPVQRLLALSTEKHMLRPRRDESRAAALARLPAHAGAVVDVPDEDARPHPQLPLLTSDSAAAWLLGLASHSAALICTAVVGAETVMTNDNDGISTGLDFPSQAAVLYVLSYIVPALRTLAAAVSGERLGLEAYALSSVTPVSVSLLPPPLAQALATARKALEVDTAAQGAGAQLRALATNLRARLGDTAERLPLVALLSTVLEWQSTVNLGDMAQLGPPLASVALSDADIATLAVVARALALLLQHATRRLRRYHQLHPHVAHVTQLALAGLHALHVIAAYTDHQQHVREPPTSPSLALQACDAAPRATLELRTICIHGAAWGLCLLDAADVPERAWTALSGFTQHNTPLSQYITDARKNNSRDPLLGIVISATSQLEGLAREPVVDDAEGENQISQYLWASTLLSACFPYDDCVYGIDRDMPVFYKADTLSHNSSPEDLVKIESRVGTIEEMDGEGGGADSNAEEDPVTELAEETDEVSFYDEHDESIASNLSGQSNGEIANESFEYDQNTSTSESEVQTFDYDSTHSTFTSASTWYPDPNYSDIPYGYGHDFTGYVYYE